MDIDNIDDKKSGDAKKTPLEELENIYYKEEKSWDKLIAGLETRLKECKIEDLYLLEAEIISLAHNNDNSIHKYLYMMYVHNSRLKDLKNKQFEFYSTEFQHHLNASEKQKMIENSLAKQQLIVDLMGAHIEYIRNTNERLKQFGYSIKNRVEVFSKLHIG